MKHALQGIKTIVTEERNMRKHISFGIFPILLGWFFKVSSMEWIIIITCIFLVIIMEFLNTIFETVVDMVTEYTFHPLAKKAKDIAAGAVLVTGIFTLIVAAIIFLPKFISLYI
ncbi:diacylglycerol kinase family protein [Jeotgalibaca sp. MA1X17-3]|uniref:diacylglycerol kinase family protein n=1 Tax=Jeotgalibaca sp. MA1X17-3 TaxID=2908211 RepID=UPI001F3C20CF|nr:diacylglycerol kinase family protein [Jeotgalibaca sp. MA1X17-3]UJF16674.1 diacylglycerol kinase family protein [Jeotgalibaca sp. MA1X17-3]